MDVSYSLAVTAPPERIFELLSDYENARPTLLPAPYYTDYRVLRGGHGPGTVASWILHFTRTRFREIEAAVVDARHLTLVERDNNSTLTTSYTVAPLDEGEPQRSLVTAQTSWHGAGGVMKYIERLLAPAMMRKIHAAFLANLKNHCETTHFGNKS
ncbi:SRPBCC family protein [Mycobacterium avium subsp. hominissuis]|uniref:SRPBCC family protein n=1 Tax=Mycobacterium avium TaxID=1764 RepID=UPI001CC607E6|nr:SRPBCC family protein [Mycobacterium avium]MBZ4504452.1 SRPBCC family protein [Mycobacterium avium subsp. hominissuis]